MRVKTDDIKDSIASFISQFGKVREKLFDDRRAKLVSKDQQAETAYNRMAVRVATLEKKVMGTLDLAHAKLINQDSTLAKLAVGPPPTKVSVLTD